MKHTVCQRSMMRVAIALAWLPVIAVAQGWRDQCGYIEWEMLTGQSAASLGAGVEASMVEASLSVNGPYLPEGTSGTGSFSGTGDFVGKSFTPNSGPSAVSWHAAAVGNLYFGNSMGGAPGVSNVSCWDATSYINFVLGSMNAGTNAVTAKTQSNAWIAYSDPENENDYAELLARFDYLTATKGMVTAVGLNNGSGTTVPMLMSASYNAISCGLSNGEHSRGGTTAGPAGSGITAGRLKPLIVTPESATSWSTGAAAGMATALLSRADDGNLGANATDARVLRAILYTGATKHEFPGWSRSETQPIDGVYGAGEANLFHSWRILTAGAQPNSGAASRGWSCPTLFPNTSQSYSFALPSSGVPNSLIVTAVWDRSVMFPTYSYRPLQVITLEVYDSSNALLQKSASTIDNLQHIYLKNLPQGQTVRVQVSSNVDNTLNTTVGLAWRADPMTNATTSVAPSMGVVGQLQFTGLINGATCRVERSSDLVNWSGVHNFTATGTSASWNDPSPPSAPVFYRLRYFTP